MEEEEMEMEQDVNQDEEQAEEQTAAEAVEKVVAEVIAANPDADKNELVDMLIEQLTLIKEEADIGGFGAEEGDSLELPDEDSDGE